MTFSFAKMQAQLSAVGYKSEEFLKLKASKTLVVRSGNSEYDMALEDAMKNNWKITPYEMVAPEEMEKRIADPSVSFLASVIISGDSPNQNYHYIALFNGGKKKLDKYNYGDMIAYSPRSFWIDEKNTSDCAFRIRNIIESMVQGLEVVEKNNIDGNSLKMVNQLRDYYNQKSSKIKDRTLLISSESAGTKIKESDVSKVYPYKFEFCSREKIAKAIKEKSKDYYYFQPCYTLNKSMFVIDPSNGEVVYFAYQTMGMRLSDDNFEDLTTAIKGGKK